MNSDGSIWMMKQIHLWINTKQSCKLLHLFTYIFIYLHTYILLIRHNMLNSQGLQKYISISIINDVCLEVFFPASVCCWFCKTFLKTFPNFKQCSRVFGSFMLWCFTSIICGNITSIIFSRFRHLYAAGHGIERETFLRGGKQKMSNPKMIFIWRCSF